jgi:hypothetical protein
LIFLENHQQRAMTLLTTLVLVLNLQASEPDSARVRGLNWLLGPESVIAEIVNKMLQNQDTVLRKYGAVAARRLSKIDKGPLLYAFSVADPDVKNFAEAAIKLL